MKGSRYAIIKLIESTDYIDKINELLKGTKAQVSVYDNWMPKRVHMDKEAELNDFLKHNFSSELHDEITKWWLHVDATTPNWDLISTCQIDGKRGILLVEAKAHTGELDYESKGKELKKEASDNSKKNHLKIGDAIKEANVGINKTIGEVTISRDNCYQLSNRVAHAWWLANQGIPVILIYLGFLNVKDMEDGQRIILTSNDQWNTCFMNHAKQVGVDKMVDKWVECGGSRFKLVVRSM